MKIQNQYNLQPLNTFGIAVLAEQFACFTNIDELSYLTSYSKTNPLILGGGSNILFTKNVEGLVLKNEIVGIEKLKEDVDFVYIKVGAGVGWHNFVLYCLDNNCAGVENLALIPGSVGASPMQNIGAYAVEIKDVFYELEAWHIADKTLVTFNNKDCQFGYRESIFKQQYKNQFVITTVTFKLSKKPVFNISYGAIKNELDKMDITKLSIQAIATAVIHIRQSKLPNPAIIGNAGSFFKNPTILNDQFNALKLVHSNIVGYAVGNTHTKLAAGWLIEQCGFKGYRNGDAGCHNQQALVLVNYGNATGQQIVQLSHKIIDAVLDKFKVQLQTEVNII